MSDATIDAPDPRPDRRGLLRSVLESTAVGLAVLSGPDCVYEFVNPAYQALSPFRRMLGRPFAAVWPEAVEQVLPIFHRVSESGVPFEVDDMRVDIQRRPGGPLEESYFSFACRRLTGRPGQAPAVLVHVVDTTPLVLARRRAEDRARAEAALLAAERVARALAEGLARHQEMMSTILAHDLRSPIEAIGLTSWALIQRSGLDERQVDAVRRIAAAAKRMGNLVEDLLDLARARQGGGIPVVRERTDIGPVCDRAIQQLLDSHPGGQVRFTRSGPGEGLWDPSRLEQVVSNLVGNALERAPAGSAVEVSAAGTADELVLTVRNQGPVIPADLLPGLFDPFRRGDRSGTIGLGLYIVSEIVRAHGGDVGVTSDAAGGTCFTVRLARSGPEA